MITPLSKEGKELIFYNYKEPLKEVREGYGYMGVILSTEDGTGIQCHICGKVYGELHAHVRQAHKISNRDYKEKFGLAYKTVLISEKIRTERKIATIKWYSTLSTKEKENLKLKASVRMQEKWKKWYKEGRNQPKLQLETKNKRGTCPDQLLDKIKTCAEKIGHSPSKGEFIEFYGTQKYIHIIFKTFGSWVKAKEMLGYSSNKNTNIGRTYKKKYSPEELLEYMRIFYRENGRPPTETDCRRGLVPEGYMYRREFGSLPLARLKAGIKEMVFQYGVRGFTKNMVKNQTDKNK